MGRFFFVHVWYGMGWDGREVGEWNFFFGIFEEKGRKEREGFGYLSC